MDGIKLNFVKLPIHLAFVVINIKWLVGKMAFPLVKVLGINC